MTVTDVLTVCVILRVKVIVSRQLMVLNSAYRTLVIFSCET